MLYVVATPIGNLEDITLRALRVLKEVDLIACEDTRRTRKLLSHYGFKKPLVSYHAHNQKTRGPELIARLKRGETIALVSDAGTPGFSDPGADLVAAAWDAGIQVQAVPGPAAGVAALSMSGFKGDVAFVGFLPRRAGKRRDLLTALANEPRVLIFYEAPGRLAETLAEIASAMPDRQVLVVRELTKLYEESWRGPVTEVAQRLAGRDIKGECTLILSMPADRDRGKVNVAEELLKTARESRLTGRRLAEAVAADLKLPRRRVYQTYLELKGQNRLP
ncbi:MAG: 16S rRNA (cytidine(1402)-2'-O)-methyltransferase [Deltaproteobacteria bacterium]|nr:16S rRNA (cytidine(1402)-2'-O)-methyltransferase [Deltaproteobacteria bacterium]